MKISTIWSARVAASSLVEVITAIVIISAVFGLSVIIYVSVQRSGFSGQRIRAEIRLQEVLNDSLVSNDMELKYNDMIIRRTHQECEASQRVLCIKAEALTLDGRLLAEHKKIIYVEPE